MNQDSERSTSVLARQAAGFSYALHLIAAPELWRILLTLISGITTLLGLMLLYDTFGSEHGSESAGWLRYAVPVGVAGALHSMIFWALGRWSATRRHRILLVAVPLQILAVLGSYGTHWVHMQGKGETIGAYVLSVNGIDRGLRSFLQSYQMMASATGALADHSDKQAKVEAASGTSCGSQANSGQGPRYALRMADRDTYSEFNGELGKRQKQLETLIEQIAKAGVNTADEALGKLDELRRIVNQAKTFEADPMLGRLKQTAQQRLLQGKGPIEIPVAKRAKGGATSFTCPDAALELRLASVVDAISALKPVPEVNVPNAMEPRIGFAIALGRLTGAVMGTSVLPMSRVEMKAQRSNQLSGAAVAPERLRREDITPLLTATAIEICLTLLFMIRGGTLPEHPAMDELRELSRRRKGQVFDKIWTALGGSAAKGAVRQALARHTKFEGKNALVIVPVYSEGVEARGLHALMMILAGLGMAQCVYSGRYMKGLFTISWPQHLRTAATVYGVVRVFRMKSVDYLAFVLDAIDGSQETGGSGDGTQANGDDDALGGPSNDGTPPALEFKKAA
jgi:hypothetical protein